ncbi:sensor histidine kinase [Mucilaginibacter angelicae]|uniref:Sensor histidine kinase n=1 Tax=Mucilaginibacter angelicae TaxID=869718 RepID=A0ABV6L3B4_9SPHI
MQISTKELELFIVLITAVFILAPITLILLVNQYNLRKKKYADERIMMKQNFETEIARVRVEVHEQTLETVGSDLHDHIGQLLSLTNLTLKSIDEHNPEKTREKVDSAVTLTSKSIQELRLLGKLLQGEQILKDGLINSIRHELQWLAKSGTLSVEIDCPDNVGADLIDPNRALMTFRIFQEAINNIMKHAEATTITVSIDCSPEKLTLKINDNGCGFDVAEKSAMPGHMGLSNIMNRAGMINATVEILSTPEAGTSITLHVPYQEHHGNETH